MEQINNQFTQRIGKKDNSYYQSPFKPEYKKLPVLKGNDFIKPKPKEQPAPTSKSDKKLVGVKIFFMIAMVVAVFWLLYLVSEGYFKSTVDQDVNQDVNQPINVEVIDNSTENFEIYLNASIEVPMTVHVTCNEGGCITNSSS